MIKALLSGAIALAGVVGVVAPSQAAVYRASWDPAYGSPFPGLGWRGEVEFTTPSCSNWVDIDRILSTEVLPGGCTGEVKVNSARVDFYALGTPEPTLKSLVFEGAEIELFFGGDSVPDAIVSTLFVPMQVGDNENDPFALTRVGGKQAYFSLIFLEDIAQLYWFRDFLGEIVLLLYDRIDSPVREDIAKWGCGQVRGSNFWELCGWASPDPDGNLGPLLKFEAVSDVPEPATLTLAPIALAAMGLAGLSARRRRAQAKQ